MTKNIEVEMRSQFDRKNYVRLYKFLMKNATHLGQDDKELNFYIYPDKLLKVVNNLTQKNAKISLKLNRIGVDNNFEEHEIYINKDDVEIALKIVSSLTLNNVEYQYAYNLRDNFLYEGVEIALKYSNTWSYHAEFEIMINNITESKSAEEKILYIAKKLGVEIMTQNELKKITQIIDDGYKKNVYNKNELTTPARPR